MEDLRENIINDVKTDMIVGDIIVGNKIHCNFCNNPVIKGLKICQNHNVEKIDPPRKTELDNIKNLYDKLNAKINQT